jgi:hypothetical protein
MRRVSPTGRNFLTVEFKELALQYAAQPGGRSPDGAKGLRGLCANLFPPNEYVGREDVRLTLMETFRRQMNRFKQTLMSSRRPIPPRSARRFTLHPGPALSVSTDLEEALYEWVVRTRITQKLSVSRRLVVREALSRDPNFLGGCGSDDFLRRAIQWYYRFIKRRGLVIRRVTSSGQKLPEGWRAIAQANVRRLHDVVQRENIQVCYAPALFVWIQNNRCGVLCDVSASLDLQYRPNTHLV